MNANTIVNELRRTILPLVVLAAGQVASRRELQIRPSFLAMLLHPKQSVSGRFPDVRREDHSSSRDARMQTTPRRGTRWWKDIPSPAPMRSG